MKNIFFIAFLGIGLLFACGQSPDKPAEETMAQALPDSVAIEKTIHDFYTWYAANDTILYKINFTDDSGAHLALNEDKLSAYLAQFKASGCISDELIANETRFYRACAKLWQNKPKDEVPSGLGADRWLCAQDYVAPYNTGKVTSAIEGNRAHAKLTLSDGNYSTDFTYEMVKENGKWLIAKLGCDSGVAY